MYQFDSVRSLYGRVFQVSYLNGW